MTLIVIGGCYETCFYPKVKPGNPLEDQMPEIDRERLRKYMLIPMVGD